MHAMDAIHRSAEQRFKQGMRGVTLIELMVVIVIIGILVSIAYPGYQSQMQKTRRTDGKATLLNAAQALERCYTRFNIYNSGDCPIVADLAAGITSPEEWYVVTSVPTASAFVLTATPQGAQVDDTQCLALTLSNTNLRGTTGTLPPADCW